MASRAPIHKTLRFPMQPPPPPPYKTNALIDAACICTAKFTMKVPLVFGAIWVALLVALQIRAVTAIIAGCPSEFRQLVKRQLQHFMFIRTACTLRTFSHEDGVTFTAA